MEDGKKSLPDRMNSKCKGSEVEGNMAQLKDLEMTIAGE